MMKKILKIFGMGLFLLIFLVLLRTSTIEFIRTYNIRVRDDILPFIFSFHYIFIYSFYSLSSILILSTLLLKNRNIKVFFLGFLPIIVFPIVAKEYILMASVVINIGFWWQFLTFKKKSFFLGVLLFFVSLLFCLFLFSYSYSCEEAYKNATDFSTAWNWSKMDCEVSSGWGYSE